MARGRRNLAPAAAAGPKERHKRAQRSQYDPLAPVPEGFVAKPPIPKSKHHTYFEFVENKDKKKKLEFQVTTNKKPPPGFEFVPIGNPQLTTACKELSREKDAMIFIVSNAKENDPNQIAHQVHRIGHHIRQAILEEAKAGIVNLSHHVIATSDGEPEPIPESQQVYHAQVDAAIRDLFPRIPNTDRQMIIEHAFTRGSTNKPEKPVGLSEDITLARRVQLAVLAHIRHTHTRYDELLRETTWQNARKVVEALCLDILVKWRGDEETGRDQLDEILREVVVISDSEGEDSEEESTDDSSIEEAGDIREVQMPDYPSARGSVQPDMGRRHSPKSVSRMNNPSTPNRPNKGSAKKTNRDRTAEKRAQRGFQRYRAWEEAIRRNRGETPLPQHSLLDMPISHGQYQPYRSAVAPYEVLGRPDDGSDARIHSTAPGGMPSLNGYVAHRYPVQQTSWNSSLHAGHNAPMHHPNAKVMSGQLSTTLAPRYSPSPAAHRFQDVLLPSIEPVSPNPQPSFVRTLPPRSSDQMDFHLPRSNHPGPVSHPGDRIYVEGRTYLHPRAVDNNPPQQDPRLGASSGEGSAQFSGSRDINYNRGMLIASSLSYSTPRAHEPVSSFAPPQTRRIVVDAPRPGEPFNSVLMEDRGGFYERINTRPEDTIRARPQGVQTREPIPLTRAPQRTVELSGLVSREEASRIMEENRGIPGVELIPIIDPLPNFPLASYFPGSYDRRPRGQPQQSYRESLNSISRPVPGAERGAPPPEGYWVIRRDEGPIAPQQYQAPAYREHRNERSRANNERYHFRREHRPQPQTPPNVIVLD